MITWEELSKEYIKEINDLWADIEDAIVEFEKGMPKSYKSGLRILEKCLDLSTENIRMLSYLSTEDTDNMQRVFNENETKKEEVCNKSSTKYKKSVTTRKGEGYENCFKWLHNTE